MNKIVASKIIKAYDSSPLFYDIRGFLILHGSYRSGVLQQIKFFSNHIGKKHLEVAVGTGSLFFFVLITHYLRKGYFPDTTTAIDYVPKMLGGAKKRLALFPRTDVYQEDATALRNEDSFYDTIAIANSVHCFSNITKAMKEMYRVLSPNGTLAFNVLLYPKDKNILNKLSTRINEWGKKKGLMETPYTQEAIEKIIEDTGFELVFMKRYGNSLHILAKKPSVKF